MMFFMQIILAIGLEESISLIKKTLAKREVIEVLDFLPKFQKNF